MRRSRNAKRQIAASILTGVFILHQSMTLSASAAITTSSGWSGVSTSGNVTTINPGKIDGGIGFQKYDQFVLDKGSTANLNFTDSYNTFVNLLDGQYTINGVLNTVKNGSFHDGNAVFISTDGMVVGQDGLLNVGSLTVRTLDADFFPETADSYSRFNKGGTLQNYLDGGTIRVDGKILSTNNIKLLAKNINIGSTGGLVAGISNTAGGRTNYTAANKSAADNLFNTLVNTNNITSNSQYKNSTGVASISINNASALTTDTFDNNGTITIAGKIANYATTDTPGEEGRFVDTYNIGIYGAGTGGMEISGDLAANGGHIWINNRVGDATITNSANITNNGDVQIHNLPMYSKINDYSINVTKYDEVASGSGLTINGKITNKGDLEIINQGYQGLDFGSTADISNTGNISIVNGSQTNETVYNTNTKIADLTISGSISNSNGNLDIYNYGATKSGLNIQGTGKVSNSNGDMTITNYGAEGLNLANGGTVSGSASDITMNNYGADGMNIHGSVTATGTGDITLYNDKSGTNGILVDSTGKVNGANNVYIKNYATGRDNKRPTNLGGEVGGVNIRGNVTAGKTADILSEDGNIIIGYTTNDNFVTANNINITANDASILNYGVEKTLLNATGNLNMKATNGRIGDNVQQNACKGSGCTGVGRYNDGSRDFTKSINANVDGTVTASTSGSSSAAEGLVINYASVGNDMNIKSINADGRVILTVDDDFAESNTGRKYNMNSSGSGTNVQGWAISLISEGNIGTAGDKLTFIQEKNDNSNKMDVLANKNIYIKENSYDDKTYFNSNGEIAKNKVCTLISREGSIDAEFGGNTVIENTTAEDTISIVTRGTSLEIENLGDIQGDLKNNGDYFGEYTNGTADGGFLDDSRKTQSLPDEVTLKALDINKTTRPNGSPVGGPIILAV